MTTSRAGEGEIKFLELKATQGESNRVIKRGGDIVRKVLALAQECKVIPPETSMGRGQRPEQSVVRVNLVSDLIAKREVVPGGEDYEVTREKLEKLVSEAKEQVKEHRNRIEISQTIRQKKVTFEGPHSTRTTTLKRQLNDKIKLLERMAKLLDQICSQKIAQRTSPEEQAGRAAAEPLTLELNIPETEKEIEEIEKELVTQKEKEEEVSPLPQQEVPPSEAPQEMALQPTEEKKKRERPVSPPGREGPEAMEGVEETEKRQAPEEPEEAPSAKIRHMGMVGGAAASVGSFVTQDATRIAAVAVERGGFRVAEGIAAGVGAMTRLHPATQVALAAAAAFTELPSMDTLQKVSAMAGGLTMFALTGEIFTSIAAGSLAGRVVPPIARGAVTLANKIFITPEFLRKVAMRIAQRHSRTPPTTPRK